MKYAIIVDSTAALPEAFVKERDIKILPLHIHLNGESFPDYTSELKLEEVYDSGQINVKADIATSPLTLEEMKDYFLKNIVPEYDVAVCQSVSKELSVIYENIGTTAHSIARDSRRLRNQLDISTPFRITYMNTGTTGAGQGLVAIFAEAALSKGMEYTNYKTQVNRFTQSVKGFTIVKDIIYSRNRSRTRGLDVVSLPKALFGKVIGMSPIVVVQNDELVPVVMQVGFAKSANRLFNYAIDRIKEGLYFDCINISIAGATKELAKYSAFSQLQEVAKKSRVSLMVGVSTFSSSINYSPGCISMGIAPKNQDAIP